MDFISDMAVGNQLTFMIVVCGFVKFQDKVSHPFQQNFTVTAQRDKWKIASDCFRLQEAMRYVPNKSVCLLVVSTACYRESFTFFTFTSIKE
jgi:hypothetical protein